MKKIAVMFLTLLIILILVVESVFATEYICMYGTVSGEAKSITILAFDKNTYNGDVNSVDIRYVNQITPSADGDFRLVLPLESSDDLIIRSNIEMLAQSEEINGTVYVSEKGSDSNDGLTKATALATLDAAYQQLFCVDEIVLLDSISYKEPPKHSGKLKIRGESPDVMVSLPDEISLNGDLEIDGVTLNNASTVYANGHCLTVTDTVLSTGTLTSGRLTVYGGKKEADLIGDTNLVLLGGKYKDVYGGGNRGSVIGNTNVIFGGNANIGEGIDDQNKSTYSPCYVYGGGNEAKVTGKSNVTLDGNAVTRYLVGAGSGPAGTAVDTNVFIRGGKVMNVYGGSLDTELVNCDTHIIMMGGLAESLFGGSYSKNLTGNTYITINGGDISRRVYTGCYNGVGLSWDSSYHVIGTTALTIGPSAQLVSYTELDKKNKLDCGIYAGSRVSQNFSEEVNTIIYSEDCYDIHKSKIGCIINGGIRQLNSWHDYVVKATSGGKVFATSKGGTIKIVPDVGYVGEFEGVKYEKEGLADISPNQEANIIFVTNAPKINELTAIKNDVKVEGTANVTGADKEISATLWLAVFEKNSEKLICCTSSEIVSDGNKDFRLDCVFEAGKEYILKAFLWDDGLTPLSMYYSIDLR